MVLTQVPYTYYSGGEPEKSIAPSTVTAGELCPDLTHTEVPAKGSVFERRHQRV